MDPRAVILQQKNALKDAQFANSLMSEMAKQEGLKDHIANQQQMIENLKNKLTAEEAARAASQACKAATTSNVFNINNITNTTINNFNGGGGDDGGKNAEIVAKQLAEIENLKQMNLALKSRPEDTSGAEKELEAAIAQLENAKSDYERAQSEKMKGLQDQLAAQAQLLQDINEKMLTSEEATKAAQEAAAKLERQQPENVAEYSNIVEEQRGEIERLRLMNDKLKTTTEDTATAEKELEDTIAKLEAQKKEFEKAQNDKIRELEEKVKAQEEKHAAELAAQVEAAAKENAKLKVDALLSSEDLKKVDLEVEKFFAGNLKDLKISTDGNIKVDEFKEKFKEKDVDDNGMISAGDLYDLLMESGADDDKAASHVSGFYSKLKMDSDEFVNADDFLDEYMRMQNYVAMKQIQSLMTENDTNNDGSLNMDEFMMLLIKNVGAGEAAATTAKIFQEIDKDQNGSLSLEELATWYFQKEEIRKKYTTKPTVVAAAVTEEVAAEDVQEATVLQYLEENATAQAKAQAAYEFQKTDQQAKMKALLEAKKAARNKHA